MRYILAVLGVIVLLFLIVVLLFNGGGDNASKETRLTSSQLIEFADKDSRVSVTTIGRLVGNESHNSIRIVVTPVERRLEILNSYSNNATRTETFPNTQEAYENFLAGLSGQGFLNYKNTNVQDQRTVCPTGNRFNYDLSEGSETRSSLWAVSCNDTGTFAGRGPTVRQLFQAQIPDYSQLVTGVTL